ncbi:nucleotide sugar dehydrogenase [Domibacillus enclensis]|uniref:UDP-N-acetyl-D-mannosamine dehydrogenase n=1 Tax=Domibacillus enclensis TaxID=1017273 RepID=A0A1N6RKB3_9BACI|nr:nucleotide sugar dehydrogenase [Domibacillus enclensis]OXS79081.1 UDP-N-acetyl-D-mannosamine dehydrogenase [Domibacillus enclensis]SIQ29217.1 UDP-N-acetyl-D-mannosaminuronic acid dehydrogenase [Domibacillus enclensis]
MKKSICVVGLGYIGLPTAVMFANHGHSVHGVDVNEKAVSMISEKQLHIEENGLQERLDKAIDSGAFTVSTTPQKADVFIIAVPSPIMPDKTANLEYVRQATASVVPYLEKGNLVILESTVPPRTVQDVMLPELEKAGLEIGTDLFVSHSPERVIPGRVFEELVSNDRIIGGYTPESARQTTELYQSFVQGQMHETDATTAELVKVMENTYRDINIAFANELAKLAGSLGVNIWEAIKLANYHPRVNVHEPGPGVGGHCIAVDPWFLVELAPETAKMIHLARQTNDGMPAYTAQMTASILDAKGIKDPKVAVFGLAFKGNIDDMRESPSMDVIEALRGRQVNLSAFDPHIKQNNIDEQTQSQEEALQDASAILILTSHNKFKDLDPSSISNMKDKVVIDTKNCIDRAKWEAAGFDVYVLGDSKN